MISSAASSTLLRRIDVIRLRCRRTISKRNPWKWNIWPVFGISFASTVDPLEHLGTGERWKVVFKRECDKRIGIKFEHTLHYVCFTVRST